jgi:hypothetical protein
MLKSIIRDHPDIEDHIKQIKQEMADESAKKKDKPDNGNLR